MWLAYLLLRLFIIKRCKEIGACFTWFPTQACNAGDGALLLSGFPNMTHESPIGQSNSCNVSGYPTVGDSYFSIVDCSLHSEFVVFHVVMPGCTSPLVFIYRDNIRFDLLRTGSVELTSNKILERGFLEPVSICLLISDLPAIMGSPDWIASSGLL